jgi:hypothetical protein
MVNRSALTVKVRQPFIEWLGSLPDSAETTLEKVNHDSSIYLLPEYLVG